jgi:hypothetical protein
LVDEHGFRIILNNQVDNATATIYYNSGCSNPATQPLPAGQSESGDIGPINSLSLQP